ncbi:MAG: hypothetical protein PGN21_05055 [Sphingomonas paucimobilis]
MKQVRDRAVRRQRLTSSLRIKAIDDVNLLVAAGVNDPLFHAAKRAVGYSMD